MHIHCLGINHHTATVSLRERLAFTEEQTKVALARLGCGVTMTAVSEMVIVSTCNRTEIYAASSQRDAGELEAFLSETRAVSRQEIRAHIYHYLDEKAVRHLQRVAAGLDSLVLGEPQILGQVTRAFELARGGGASGPLLNRLFQRAIHAGKRARTETRISHNPASVSSLAASLAEKSVSNLKESQVVVLGAGEMAELAVEALRKRGTNRILVVNRTLDRARELADRWQAQAETFENMLAAIASADILISSTGAPHTVIHPVIVEQALVSRPARPLVMIDIAVPRDIDPEVGNLPGVKLYDMDNLGSTLEQSLSERAAEVPLVEAILEDETAKFMQYYNSLDMLPLIADIRQQAESIRRNELEKTLRRMPDLSESDRKRIEALTQALVKKLLDAPTNRLRAEAACPHAPEYASVARTLFGVSTQADPSCEFSGEACQVSLAAD